MEWYGLSSRMGRRFEIQSKGLCYRGWNSLPVLESGVSRFDWLLFFFLYQMRSDIYLHQSIIHRPTVWPSQLQAWWFIALGSRMDPSRVLHWNYSPYRIPCICKTVRRGRMSWRILWPRNLRRGRSSCSKRHCVAVQEVASLSLLQSWGVRTARSKVRHGLGNLRSLVSS